MFQVVRHRFSITQGEAEVFYNGESVVKYGDTIGLDGQYHRVGGWGSVHSDEHFIEAAKRQYPEKCGIKTFANWQGSLSEYLQIGDVVDEEMADYFLNVLPPACWRADLIQIGEPYSHVNGRATYATLRKQNGEWVYAGHCHRGEYHPPVEREAIGQ